MSGAYHAAPRRATECHSAPEHHECPRCRRARAVAAIGPERNFAARRVCWRRTEGGVATDDWHRAIARLGRDRSALRRRRGGMGPSAPGPPEPLSRSTAPSGAAVSRLVCARGRKEGGAVGDMATAGDRQGAVQAGPRMQARGRVADWSARRSSRNRAAATIGPIVCDDDGPMPILKPSNTDRNMLLPVPGYGRPREAARRCQAVTRPPRHSFPSAGTSRSGAGRHRRCQRG